MYVCMDIYIENTELYRDIDMYGYESMCVWLACASATRHQKQTRMHVY